MGAKRVRSATTCRMYPLLRARPRRAHPIPAARAPALTSAFRSPPVSRSHVLARRAHPIPTARAHASGGGELSVWGNSERIDGGMKRGE